VGLSIRHTPAAKVCEYEVEERGEDVHGTELVLDKEGEQEHPQSYLKTRNRQSVRTRCSAPREYDL
jgi:hypothetical protein